MKSSASPLRGGRIPNSESLTASPSSAPSSHHSKYRSSPHRFTKENIDPNHNANESPYSRSGKTILSAKNRSPLPPRPPANTSGNPLKRKLNLEGMNEHCVAPASAHSDSGVQVVLRMRPLKGSEGEDDLIVQKISSNSVSVLDHTFTYDSVADTRSTQEDIFQLVGLPLVENCLAGFNSSIFAYGQTGSGKTYTMWGPLAILSNDGTSNIERGLTPRVFELLFARINEEQLKHSKKQLSYQCRCSFLEIYNEQITDLLDPIRGNLQIREDVKSKAGIYVENLTEAFVCSTRDVIQLLTKGLEYRRMGATSLNAESSRSHCVFTCIVESRSKCMSDGFNSLRTSRINLVDLAGSERQKQTGAAGDRLKEAGNINRSLSQLGNLINILAEITQSGKQRHIPYRDSKLTFLLQESLGGNAKLAMICAVSPSMSCKSETFSTLRFAQRAKAVKNKAVVNEVTQDDVNVLREQIRQLKEELLRMKANGVSTGQNGNYSSGWNARRSLAILRQSLRGSMTAQLLEAENDEEMEIDDADVEKPLFQSSDMQNTVFKRSINDVDETSSNIVVSKEISLVHQDLLSEHAVCSSFATQENNDIARVNMEVCELEKNPAVEQEEAVMPNMDMEIHQSENSPNTDVMKSDGISNKDEKIVCENSKLNFASQEANIEEKILNSLGTNLLNKSQPQQENISLNQNSCLSIVPCQPTQIIEMPTSSMSPMIDSCSRKSLRTSLLMSASQENLKEPEKAVLGALGSSSNRCFASNTLVTTEHLAKSLHRGLEIFDLHQQKLSMRKSSFKFSPKHVHVKESVPAMKVDRGIQTLPLESESFEDQSIYICSYCKNKPPPLEYKDAGIDTDLQLVPVNEFHHSEKSIQKVPKAVKNVLAGSIRREMVLEEHCAKQTSEIALLNRLVQQYKLERECNLANEQTREGKICRLEGLMDGIIPTDHYLEEEFMSLTNEHKILREKYESHPEVMRLKIDLKRVQDEVDGYKNFFDFGEKEVLMEEIQDLRCQLQYYVDSPFVSKKHRSLLKLTYTSVPIETSHLTRRASESATEVEESFDKKIEEERQLWTEAESKWITLAEDLRLELEANHALAEKQKVELDSERKCLEELKEALKTAIEGHACILEQYADLQEKHVQLLARHRTLRDGISDVKKSAVRAGLKGPESKFIDALAAEISTLKSEREMERIYWKDENRELEAQLSDTAEAVQAAGELLVRLKESEEAATLAQKQIVLAEKEVEKCHLEIEDLKRKHEAEVSILNQFLTESRLPKEAEAAIPTPAFCDVTKTDNYDNHSQSLTDDSWKQEFAPFTQENENDFSRGAEHHSWFSDYDRCNM